MCMKEVALIEMPYVVRRTFCYILSFCDVLDASTLWSKFAAEMTEDFTHKGHSETKAICMALMEIEKML